MGNRGDLVKRSAALAGATAACVLLVLVVASTAPADTGMSAGLIVPLKQDRWQDRPVRDWKHEGHEKNERGEKLAGRQQVRSELQAFADFLDQLERRP